MMVVGMGDLPTATDDENGLDRHWKTGSGGRMAGWLENFLGVKVKEKRCCYFWLLVVVKGRGEKLCGLRVVGCLGGCCAGKRRGRRGMGRP